MPSLFVTTLLFFFISIPLRSSNAQYTNNPFLNFLSNENIGRLTQMATDLVASAAKHSAAANIESLTRPGHPEPGPVSLNSRPSEMFGQSITNALSPTINKFAEFSVVENRGLMPSQQERNIYDIESNSGTKSLMDIAEAFLGTSGPDKSRTFLGAKTQTYPKNTDINLLPTLRQLAPGATNNFGIPKGEGSSIFNIRLLIAYRLSR
ncbi:unnamed protein product [Onchocerca ochengi]|uniref:Uncharacterized protein n=1 Tax=Onchocerca ochengi TaxID=42157 RepID=A0A182EPW4_ONCOC|nr:unnamed protein product [Onchocerca ochengi]VDM93923.1 unnamed protein product [Onchocerca ochengi]